jgi:hypothetical protein
MILLWSKHFLILLFTCNSLTDKDLLTSQIRKWLCCSFSCGVGFEWWFIFDKSVITAIYNYMILFINKKTSIYIEEWI